MPSSQDRALQALSSELARLDRQITALLKRQDELLQWKSQLEASREVSPSMVAPASTHRETPFSRQPQPHLVPGNASAADGLPDLHRHPSRSSPPATDSPPSAHRLRLHLRLGPRARVLDIAKRLPSALRRRDAFGTVVIHVGTNDISDRRSEVLKEHYQTLLDTARKKTDARIVISGPLPTYRRGSDRFSRLFALQSWLVRLQRFGLRGQLVFVLGAASALPEGWASP
ncbi:hypothetical protein SRHO_G00302690 [Serrasalmus rhombeus]